MRFKNTALLLFLLIHLNLTYGSHAQAPRRQLSISIDFPPQWTNIEGRQAIFYEVHLTNASKDSVALKRLVILGSRDSSVMLTVEGSELKRRSYKSIVSNTNEIILPPSASSLLYIELSEGKIAEGLFIKHRLEFEAMHSARKELLVLEYKTPLQRKSPIVLGAPLDSGLWATVYNPSWERGHRRVVFTVGGVQRIPGRFAIDFIKLDSFGRYAVKNEDEIKNWYGYGVNVLAVADAIVMSIRDDFPESTTLSAHPRWPSEKATGNYISLKIGKNVIAFYEHLRPGSIRVKPGQKVKKGEVIASLGFTGQSTGPHLHFHLANNNSPLGAEGIPYVFEHFAVKGFYPEMEKFGKEQWVPSERLSVSKEFPAANSVIKFLD